MSDTKLNIHQKIIELKKGVSVFVKDKKAFNYTYVDGTQIYNKIKDHMNELGLLLIPQVKHSAKNYQIFEYTTVDKYGKEKRNIEYIVELPMVYEWVNAEDPEDSITCHWAMYGQQDDISKAFGSGLTYSERYFLLKFMGIPTPDDDPDAKPPKKPIEKPAQLTGVDALIADIEKTCKDLSTKIDKALIGKAIQTHHITNGEPSANYNSIKDEKIAKLVLEELNKLNPSKTKDGGKK